MAVPSNGVTAKKALEDAMRSDGLITLNLPCGRIIPVRLIQIVEDTGNVVLEIKTEDIDSNSNSMQKSSTVSSFSAQASSQAIRVVEDADRSVHRSERNEERGENLGVRDQNSREAVRMSDLQLSPATIEEENDNAENVMDESSVLRVVAEHQPIRRRFNSVPPPIRRPPSFNSLPGNRCVPRRIDPQTVQREDRFPGLRTRALVSSFYPPPPVSPTVIVGYLNPQDPQHLEAGARGRSGTRYNETPPLQSNTNRNPSTAPAVRMTAEEMRNQRRMTVSSVPPPVQRFPNFPSSGYGRNVEPARSRMENPIRGDDGTNTAGPPLSDPQTVQREDGFPGLRTRALVSSFYPPPPISPKVNIGYLNPQDPQHLEAGARGRSGTRYNETPPLQSNTNRNPSTAPAVRMTAEEMRNQRRMTVSSVPPPVRHRSSFASSVDTVTLGRIGPPHATTQADLLQVTLAALDTEARGPGLRPRLAPSALIEEEDEPDEDHKQENEPRVVRDPSAVRFREKVLSKAIAARKPVKSARFRPELSPLIESNEDGEQITEANVHKPVSCAPEYYGQDVQTEFQIDAHGLAKGFGEMRRVTQIQGILPVHLRFGNIDLLLQLCRNPSNLGYCFVLLSPSGSVRAAMESIVSPGGVDFITRSDRILSTPFVYSNSGDPTTAGVIPSSDKPGRLRIKALALIAYQPVRGKIVLRNRGFELNTVQLDHIVGGSRPGSLRAILNHLLGLPLTSAEQILKESIPPEERSLYMAAFAQKLFFLLKMIHPKEADVRSVDYVEADLVRLPMVCTQPDPLSCWTLSGVGFVCDSRLPTLVPVVGSVLRYKLTEACTMVVLPYFHVAYGTILLLCYSDMDLGAYSVSQGYTPVLPKSQRSELQYGAIEHSGIGYVFRKDQNARDQIELVVVKMLQVDFAEEVIRSPTRGVLYPLDQSAITTVFFSKLRRMFHTQTFLSPDHGGWSTEPGDAEEHDALDVKRFFMNCRNLDVAATVNAPTVELPDAAPTCLHTRKRRLPRDSLPLARRKCQKMSDAEDLDEGKTYRECVLELIRKTITDHEADGEAHRGAVEE